jgi:hypothetical protein
VKYLVRAGIEITCGRLGRTVSAWARPVAARFACTAQVRWLPPCTEGWYRCRSQPWVAVGLRLGCARHPVIAFRVRRPVLVAAQVTALGCAGVDSGALVPVRPAVYCSGRSVHGSVIQVGVGVSQRPASYRHPPRRCCGTCRSRPGCRGCGKGLGQEISTLFPAHAAGFWPRGKALVGAPGCASGRGAGWLVRSHGATFEQPERTRRAPISHRSSNRAGFRWHSH